MTHKWRPLLTLFNLFVAIRLSYEDEFSYELISLMWHVIGTWSL